MPGGVPSRRVIYLPHFGSDPPRFAPRYKTPVLAAASTAAAAKDLKQDKKATAPTVAATQMSDAEMDRVTAGGAEVSTPGPDVNVLLPPTSRAFPQNLNANGNAANLIHPL